jgi:hypothetical protein
MKCKILSLKYRPSQWHNCYRFPILKKVLKIPKGLFEAINQGRTDNITAKKKRHNGNANDLQRTVAMYDIEINFNRLHQLSTYCRR